MSNIQQRLKTISPNDVAVCSVVKAKLFYGAMRSRSPRFIAIAMGMG
jgi:tRNA(fMet)-specific endonuclease VapC